MPTSRHPFRSNANIARQAGQSALVLDSAAKPAELAVGMRKHWLSVVGLSVVSCQLSVVKFPELHRYPWLAALRRQLTTD
jgi:hypothetical protein